MAKAIHFIDLHQGKHFTFDKREVTPLNLKNKKSFTVARLYFTDITTHNFKLEKSMSAQELRILSEIKMYDEIGLDATVPHQISYITKDASSGELKLVESFAINKEKIQQKYQEGFSFAKHIDFIAIPFLVFETLYTHEIIEKKNDLFIMIEEEEAFSSFYKEGQYVTSKKRLSLKEMVKELENLNIQIDVKRLTSILLEKGLEKERYELHEYDIYDYIQKSFDSFFSTTYNIAIHNRNVYGFTEVERIYFSLNGKLIPGLELMAARFFENATLLPLDFFKNDTATILDIISASYMQDKLEANDQLHNFTIFEKKRPFLKSEVVRFSMALAASLLLFGSYPLYQWSQINTIEKENHTLNAQLQVLSRSNKKLKEKNKKLIQALLKVKQEKSKIDADLQNLEHIAKTLLTLKSKDSKYTPMFLTINALLKKYKLSVDNVKQVGAGAMDFEIFSVDKKRDNIAKFMRDLLNQGYSSVSSSEISQKSELYKSIITVKK